MKLHPVRGTAFVIEDTEDYSKYEKMGLSVPDDAKGVGSTGVILEVSNDQEGLFRRLLHYLFSDRIVQRFEKGQRVIFDKFVASDIYYREDGKEVKNLKSVHCDCILGTIS